MNHQHRISTRLLAMLVLMIVCATNAFPQIMKTPSQTIREATTLRGKIVQVLGRIQGMEEHKHYDGSMTIYFRLEDAVGEHVSVITGTKHSWMTNGQMAIVTGEFTPSAEVRLGVGEIRPLRNIVSGVNIREYGGGVIDLLQLLVK